MKKGNKKPELSNLEIIQLIKFPSYVTRFLYFHFFILKWRSYENLSVTSQFDLNSFYDVIIGFLTREFQILSVVIYFGTLANALNLLLAFFVMSTKSDAKLSLIPVSWNDNTNVLKLCQMFFNTCKCEKLYNLDRSTHINYDQSTQINSCFIDFS